MISTGELRKGVVIELDGELWQILDYHHIKMGRGSAQVRIKLRNVKKGSTVEKSFQAGDRWPRAQIDRRPVQFLYRDGDDLHFMETESYEQFSLRAETLDDAVPYLKEGMTLDRTSYQGDTLGVELPVTVDLLVTETEPGFAGDTAQGARKNATMETGSSGPCRCSSRGRQPLRIDTPQPRVQTRLLSGVAAVAWRRGRATGRSGRRAPRALWAPGAPTSARCDDMGAGRPVRGADRLAMRPNCARRAQSVSRCARWGAGRPSRRRGTRRPAQAGAPGTRTRPGLRRGTRRTPGGAPGPRTAQRSHARSTARRYHPSMRRPARRDPLRIPRCPAGTRCPTTRRRPPAAP